MGNLRLPKGALGLSEVTGYLCFGGDAGQFRE